MKALVLHKMGKTEAALENLLNAREIFLKYDADRIEDVTLSTMQMAFSRLGRCQYIFFSLLDLSSINCIFPVLEMTVSFLTLLFGNNS